MPGIDGLRDLLSLTKHDSKDVSRFNETERRLFLVLATLLLLAIAIILLVVTSVKSSGALSECKAIILQAQRNSCLAVLANSTGNYSVCTLIQPLQGSYQCIGMLAQREKNLSGCQLINPGNGEYNSCIVSISYAEGNIDYCQMLKGINESICAYAIARQHTFSNLSECGDISNSTMQSECSSIYYNNLALSSRNPSYCSMLSNSTNGSLLSSVIGADSNASTLSSSSLLAYLYFNMTPINFCYYELANLLGKPSLCAYTGNTLSQLCYAENLTAGIPVSSNSSINYTIGDANVSALCSSVPNYAQSLCTYSAIIEKAVANRNASQCYAINDTSYMDSCILSIATKYNNVSYCNYITNNASSKLACTESAQVLTGNDLG